MTYSIVLLSFPLNKLSNLHLFPYNSASLDFDHWYLALLPFPCSESRHLLQSSLHPIHHLLFLRSQKRCFLLVSYPCALKFVFYCCLGDLSPHIPPPVVVEWHPSIHDMSPLSAYLYFWMCQTCPPNEILKGTLETKQWRCSFLKESGPSPQGHHGYQLLKTTS